MELPGKVHQETSKSSKAENSLIKQSADGHSQGDSQPRDETDVRRQSTHGWEGGWEYFGRGWGKFEADYGEDPRSKPSAKDTTEPSTTTNMAWKNEAGPEQATGSESSLLPVEAQTLGASVPSSSPIASQSEVEAFCAHLTRLWPEVSATDAFVHFAGRGSDTLFAGTFTSVANSVGLPVDIFPVLSGDKSYVHLEDWLGFLEGAVQMVPEAPAHQREEEFEQRVRDLLENLEEEEDTSTESTGAANQGSEDEPSSPEEDDHSLTQPNDLKALVQVLQAQLKLSEEETNRWQREAHRQEEAATELREKMRLTQVWGTIGSVQELIKSAGIGFIRPYSGPVNGKDLFFHKSELKKGNFHTLAIGDEVSYEVMLNPAKKRTFAANVMLTKRYS
mmetsp:Transcript_32845/g.70893  ORF Transcript_32845/g.70893 Transcript_32845/m.70893 type:complete len:391 (-) Transcript_32845:111-1283(-)